MIKKLSTILPLVLLLLTPAIASAHVVVTPSQAGIGQELTFNASVPNERQTDITNFRLAIPSGATDVIPTTKTGWSITTKANSDNDVSSIEWSGGVIPAGQRQDFSFSAQVAGQPTDLNWKAYQTYADGIVVHWDQTPTAKSDDSQGNAGPYSVTHVVNDLAGANKSSGSSNDISPATLVVALLALILAVVSLLKKTPARQKSE